MWKSFCCFGFFLEQSSAIIWSWSCSRDFSWDVSHGGRVETAAVRTPLLFLPLVLHVILCCVFWILTLPATSVCIWEKSQQVDMKNLLLSVAEDTETVTQRPPAQWLRKLVVCAPNMVSHGEKAVMMEYSLQWSKELFFHYSLQWWWNFVFSFTLLWPSFMSDGKGRVFTRLTSFWRGKYLQVTFTVKKERLP